MDALTQIDTIVELLSKLDVETRREHLGGDGGGLCRIRGRAVVFIDLDADVSTQISRCVDALAAMPEVEEKFLPPAIREQIERLRG